MTILINLVGEQPLPNLMPVALEDPRVVVLIHSDFTEQVAGKLGNLMGAEVISHCVDAYDIAETETYLRGLVADRCWPAGELLFNLTGGTKPMSLGAFRVAIEMGSRALYVKTEGRGAIYFYDFQGGSDPIKVTPLDTLPPVLTLSSFLHAFRGNQYQVKGDYAKTEPGRSFEQAVHKALVGSIDEVMVGLKLDDVVDIDLVLRTGNEVALVECKIGQNGLKDAIDQLNTAGGRDYLGTYTRKVIVSNVSWKTKTNLSALAQARRINIIEIVDYQAQDPALSEAGVDHLRKGVERLLGKKRPA
jgi:hypothetical protein